MSKLPKSAGNAASRASRSQKRVSAKPGPGRPTATRVEAINRAILLAAYEQFWACGHEATRMEAIAAAAGVSKGTLYDRYPTKESLLRAVLAGHVVTWWSQEWDPDTEPKPTDLRKRLKHRARRLMEFYCSGRLAPLERLFSSVKALDELRRTRHEVGHKRTAHIIAQDIIDRMTNPPIQPQAAVRLADTLMGMLYGWWRIYDGIRRVRREEAMEFADYAVDLLFDGKAAWEVKPQAE